MSDISKLDKNFEVKTSINRDDIKFYNADNSPFKIYGVFRENGKYRRMPESVAKTVSAGVYGLHANTAGGRVRFTTDSLYIAINTKMENIGKMPHFAFTGSSGFDLYIDGEYERSFVPAWNIEDGYESIIVFEECKEREVTINFPLYSDVKELYIGLQETATVGEAKPYKYEKPVVYYGSSITQGGCASRPGSCYTSAVSRMFDIDHINLGFSGNAKAEDEMIEYVKNLDMSVFVYDYDHNAPTEEHLEKTHEKMFKAIREAQPELPIIMMSRPKFYLNDKEKNRLEIIKNTYNNAIASGDKNVYLIDNVKLTELCLNDGTVDSCHPTDYGFASMAKAVAEVMKKILKD